MTDNTYTQIRAVCLVAIMALSMIGIGAAMPAKAAAASVDENHDLQSEDEETSDGNETSEPQEARVNIDSPESSDKFVRGSIIPIALEFANTQRGTITIGDRNAQNVIVDESSDDEDDG